MVSSLDEFYFAIKRIQFCFQNGLAAKIILAADIMQG